MKDPVFYSDGDGLKSRAGWYYQTSTGIPVGPFHTEHSAQQALIDLENQTEESMSVLSISELPAHERADLAMESEVSKLVSMLRPVPMGEALKRRDGIKELVTIHCSRQHLGAFDTAHCVDLAIAIWRNGGSASKAQFEGCALADKIALERANPQPPRAA